MILVHVMYTPLQILLPVANFKTAESRATVWPVKPVTSAAVRSKVVVLLLVIHCLLLLPLLDAC